MRRGVYLVIASSILSAACTEDARRPLTGPTQHGAAQRPDVIPGQYVVVLRPAAQDVHRAARDLVATHGGTLRFTYSHALKGFSVSGLPGIAAAALARHPLVEYVAPDQVVHLAETEQLGATWGLNRVDQRDRPHDSRYFYSATGAGVKVYILDTGIRFTHDEFEKPDGSSRAIAGVDIATPGGDASDCNGHGTHVAGTVGGKTFGVAKEVTLVSVRIFNCDGFAFGSAVLAGVDWVTADHQAGQPAVANVSFTGDFSQVVNDAVTNSVGDGITYAVAAGNDNIDACTQSPGSTPAALTIAASGIVDWRPAFSNWGSCVDMFAPGVDITSAWRTSDQAASIISGTSMATPHVSGAAALYLQTNPGAAPASVEQALERRATLGKIRNPGIGSPNLLLYTRWIGGGLSNPQGVIASSKGLTGSPFGLDVASTGVTYVTRFAGDRVQRVNLPSFPFVAGVVVGDVPKSIAFNPAGTTAWVTNEASRSVGVIDVTTNTMIRTIPLAGTPAVVAVRPDAAVIYVSSTNGNVYAIDAATDAIVAAIPVGSANGLAFNRGGTRLYASLLAGGAIKVIDTQTHTVVNTFSIGGQVLQGIAVSLDDTELYVADGGTSAVLRVVNVASGAQVATVPLGGKGFGVALSPDNARIYVGIPLAGKVKIIGRASRTVVGTITTGGKPRRLDLSVKGETLVIADQSGKVHFVK